jgi:hypothetical protein
MRLSIAARRFSLRSIVSFNEATNSEVKGVGLNAGASSCSPGGASEYSRRA